MLNWVHTPSELASRGIEILTRARVAGYKNGSVLITDGRSVPASTMVWTAGNCGNPLVASLSLPNRGGRLLVNEYLEVENTPGIWALGDCAMVPNPLTNGFHPATAQHALRQGRVLARNLVAEIAGTKKKRFRFSAFGAASVVSFKYLCGFLRRSRQKVIESQGFRTRPCANLIG